MIAQEKLTPFERLLFRATRGNMFLKSAAVGAVADPSTSEKQEKAVFVVFYAGERARTKILKVSWPSSLPCIAMNICSQHCAMRDHAPIISRALCHGMGTSLIQGARYVGTIVRVNVLFVVRMEPRAQA